MLCTADMRWLEWVGWLEWLMSNRCQAMTDVSTRDAVCSWGWCFAHWSTRAFHAVWVFSNNINCHNNNKINRNTCHAEVKDKKATTEDICTTCLSWQWCARQYVFQQNQCKVLCVCLTGVSRKWLIKQSRSMVIREKSLSGHLAVCVAGLGGFLNYNRFFGASNERRWCRWF